MDNMQKYATCMEEIKLRQRSIRDIVVGNNSTSFEMTNIEFVCLQFRKILELIALATLAANREQYGIAYRKFYEHWKAKRILNDLKKINPNFYPVPTKQIVVNGKVVETVAIKDGFLTKSDFEKIYNDCSQMLHSKNPYNKKEINIEELKKKFMVWDNKIITLLNHHQVQLLNSNKQLWVIMNGNTDGRVHVTEMQKIS